MSDVDPDFLALTQKQRIRIDRAFDRGLPKLRSSGRKRRKLNGGNPGRKISLEDDGGGGFMDDVDGEGGFMDGGDVMDTGGGFMDDGGEDEGGFMVNDGEEGGFMPDDNQDEALPSRPKSGSSRTAQPNSNPLRSGKIPFSSIPGLLASLNLPADEDVLNVFRASATGWATDDDEPSGPSRKKGKIDQDGDETLGVERKDFRAVCAAIMGDDADDEEGMEEEAEAVEEVSQGSSGDEDEDTFTLDDGSSLSSLSSDSEYGASRKKTRTERTRRTQRKSASPATSTPAKRTRTKKTKLEEAVELGPLRLAGRQKEAVKDLWDMLKRTNAEEQVPARGRGGKKGSANVLGREEVKMWAREMGEMWTEDEITDMVTLFSTQHEGRGLSFDDFGQVMLRARVV